MIQDKLWAERYRPDSLDEVVGQDEATRKMSRWVDDPGCPNLLLNGPPGVGKTASVVAFAKEKYGDDWQSNLIEMNASDERGIDVVRNQIKQYAQQAPSGQYDFKIIYLDEADHLCLPPGTEVITGYPSDNNQEIKKIEEVAEEGEPIPSVDFETNEVQSDKGRVIETGTQDFYRMKLSDGREVVASLNHPFFTVNDETQELVETELGELEEGDEIADFSEEIGVSGCEVCGEFTANARFCSAQCKDEGHSGDMAGEGNPMYGESWSEERREKIIKKLSDGRLAGEDNPNFDGDFHGVHWKDMNEEERERTLDNISDSHKGKTLTKEHRDSIARSLKETFSGSVSETYESGNYRYRLKDETEVECDICGEVKKVGGSDGIYVHHIDGDRNNNSEDNLMDVCPACHNFVCHDRWDDIKNGWEENKYRKDVVGDGGRNIVNTVEVESIEYDHHGKAYNITMEGTPNFMLSNGILTHNTNDAQAALRRTMEQYSDQTRFFLSCNYVNKIIDPIQSRCTVLPFTRLGDGEVREVVMNIIEGESVTYEDSAVDKIVEYVNGDARRAVQTLQTSVEDGELTEGLLDLIGQQVGPETVESLVSDSVRGNMEEVHDTVTDEVLPHVTDYSRFSNEVLKAVRGSDDIPRDTRFYAMSRVGEMERAINEGNSPVVQIMSFMSELPVVRHSSIDQYED